MTRGRPAELPLTDASVGLVNDTPAAQAAAAILQTLGAEVGAGNAARELEPVGAATADEDWARSGAMWLTGAQHGPPLTAPGAPASLALGAAAVCRLLTATRRSPAKVPARSFLAERAAAAGLVRRGRTSCGRTSRLVRCRNGDAAVSMSRPADWDLLPAVMEREGPGVATWDAIEAWCADRFVAEVVNRAQELGLAWAAVGSCRAAADTGPVRLQQMTDLPARRSPPTGLRPLVIDLSALWAGPLCAHLLARAGARVIKVESATRLDGMRADRSGFYSALHRGHECVTVDLSSSSGRGLLSRMLACADLVIDSSRSRVMPQLGIDIASVAAHGTGRTWLTISAYGRSGSDATRVGYGDDVAAAAGLVASDPQTGAAVFCGDAIADPLAGLLATATALACLRRGGGWLVDVALRGVAELALRLDASAGGRAAQAVDGGWLLAGPVGVPVGRGCPPPSGPAARPAGSDNEVVFAEFGAAT